MACDSPFYITVKWQSEQIPCPCGRCPPCQKQRVSQWGFRLRKQEELSHSAFFVTLTFDTTNVPISGRGFMTLCKGEYQKFMKRLRKLTPKNDAKISYYACGEYGTKNYRPHYHAIIFNASEENIAKAWQKGEIHIGKVSGASIAYTLKYINKGKIIPMHRNDDRLPEFSLMSKGMGANYLTEQMVSYHKADLSRAYVTLPDGVKIALPRYYKNKMYNESERKQQAHICKIRAAENDHRNRNDYINVTGDIEGFEEELESGKIQRYNEHRKKGTENRKL